MKRLVTAIALAAAAAYLIGWSPQPVFTGAAFLMAGLCFWEFSGIVEAHHIPAPGIFGWIAGLVILVWPSQTLVGISVVCLAALVAILRHPDLRAVLPQVACAIFGAFYTFAPWRFAIDLRAVSPHLLFVALAVNWVGDSAAYYTGRAFGKHKLAPRVSPGKTWEGAVASTVVAVLFAVFYLGHFFPHLPAWAAAVIAVAASIAGQLGDLAESAMKRGAGVKDSGNLLPGHGGMLDRVDSSLFSLPVVYGLYLVFARYVL